MKYLSVKKAGVIFSTGLLVAVIAIMTGCVKQNFDEPPIHIPHYPGTANAGIDTLVKLYGSHSDTMLITQDIIIKGIVVGNDESGNIYKKIYIQDETGGIDVEIDATNIYTLFKVGQRVFIECKGLYLGLYGGALELGYPYNGSIGRMPSSLASVHIFRDSLPGKKPVPITLDVTSPPFFKYINMLVAIPAVRFQDAGQPFVTGGVTTSRVVNDAEGNALSLDGNSVILYNSSYATFANNLLPQGVGTLQGIFTVFSTKYEFLVRDLNDLVNFVDTGQSVLYQNNFNSSPPDWTIFTPASNKPWAWSSQFTCMLGNGYLGNAPCDTWLISPGLDLTNVTNSILTFSTWTQFVDSGLPLPLEVKISTDYSGSGNPSAATWTPLTCILPAADSKVMTPSGDISLSAYNQKVYVAFRYRSSGVTSGTASKWEVDTFKLTGKKN
ncbi:MAG: DUF5689 domain-containing protein [Bacteroidetes bacterium]|nr:DUF5689 domain-containing protein [Bacteroidota bacterium]